MSKKYTKEYILDNTYLLDKDVFPTRVNLITFPAETMVRIIHQKDNNLLLCRKFPSFENNFLFEGYGDQDFLYITENMFFQNAVKLSTAIHSFKKVYKTDGNINILYESVHNYYRLVSDGADKPNSMISAYFNYGMEKLEKTEKLEEKNYDAHNHINDTMNIIAKSHLFDDFNLLLSLHLGIEDLIANDNYLRNIKKETKQAEKIYNKAEKISKMPSDIVVKMFTKEIEETLNDKELMDYIIPLVEDETKSKIKLDKNKQPVDLTADQKKELLIQSLYDKYDEAFDKFDKNIKDVNAPVSFYYTYDRNYNIFVDGIKAILDLNTLHPAELESLATDYGFEFQNYGYNQKDLIAKAQQRIDDDLKELLQKEAQEDAKNKTQQNEPVLEMKKNK